MPLPADRPLIIITGPTAVGKTQISFDIVEHFRGEVISADSRLFYRGLDIGTAKPTAEERKRIKHHLIDNAEIDQTLSLAVFQQAVYRIAGQLWAENKVPFVVGGTGQFIRAIMEGWMIPPRKPDRGLRAVLEAWGEMIGPAALHQRLALIDPRAAEKIEPGNTRRSVRALEVIFLTGRLFSAQRVKQSRGFQYKVVGLMRPRSELYQRVDARIAQMFEDGLVEEVRHLLAQGYEADLPALSAIGYKEVIAHIHGEMEMEEVVRLMKKRTRSYIRRQANWFKPDDPSIRWFQMHPGIKDDIIQFIESSKGWQDG